VLVVVVLLEHVLEDRLQTQHQVRVSIDDFLADALDEVRGHALGHLQQGVAHQAVGHNDIADAAEQVASLDIAHVVDARRLLEQVVRGADQVRALALFRADVDQADPRISLLVQLAGHRVAHQGVLVQVRRAGFRVRTCIAELHRTVEGRDRHDDARAVHARQATHEPCRRGNARTGVAGRDHRIALDLADRVTVR